MFEKVNPNHPDKVADRIAGAIVDLAYSKQDDPKVAVEVLIGHGKCNIIAETSVSMRIVEIAQICWRITGNNKLIVKYVEVPQDEYLAQNQEKGFKCGDNGIFKGVPISDEEQELCEIAKKMYARYKTDGKYIINKSEKAHKLIICQSNARTQELKNEYPNAVVNPLGDWTGGTNVDTGATNRKLGSDMGRAATGGGLHGKDLSKADVSVNIYCHIKAQAFQKEVQMLCAIGDEKVLDVNTGALIPYSEIVDMAKAYIKDIGGFEKLAEWGLIG